MGHLRGTGNDLAVGHGPADTGLGTDDGVVPDGEVSGDARLSGENGVPADGALPAMPTWATRRVSSPTVTLWATWTRLSVLTPRWIHVLPNVARSMALSAPISTSSSIWTMPVWGILWYRFPVRRKPETVPADDRARVDDDPAADPAAIPDRHVRVDLDVIADHRVRLDDRPRDGCGPGPRCRPGPRSRPTARRTPGGPSGRLPRHGPRG